MDYPSRSLQPRSNERAETNKHARNLSVYHFIRIFRRDDNLCDLPRMRQIESPQDHDMITRNSYSNGVSRCAAHFDLSVSGSWDMHETMRVSGAMAARAMHLIVKVY